MVKFSIMTFAQILEKTDQEIIEFIMLFFNSSKIIINLI